MAELNEAEYQALKSFARWIIREGCFEGADLDGGTIQEQALTHGLIEEVVYDPTQHKVSEHFDIEAGDRIYMFKEFMKR